MTTKHSIIVITISVAIAVAIPFVYKAREKKKIEYNTFRSGAGWGYNILVEGKLAIHQQYVPVIPEKKEFTTEAEAAEAARLVVKKLESNKSPALTKAEVEKICNDDY